MNIPFKLKCSIGILLFASTPALMAQVQSATMADPKGHVVISTGTYGYDVQNSGSATRVSAPLIETPVSINVVDQELIKDKAILNPNELANVVSGVQSNAGAWGFQSSDFIIRGFSSNGINYRDGYRVRNTDVPSDMANIERVDFVKGPGSVLYGAAQPGGSVNTITKKTLDYDYAYANVQAGSWSFLRSTIDINQVFGDVSARLNIAGDKGNSYLDNQSSNNYMIAPAIKWRINSDAELSYSGEFQKQNINGASSGLPVYTNIAQLPASASLGQSWTRQSATNNSNQGEFKYKIDADWTFRQGVFASNYMASYPSLITNAMTQDPAAIGGSLVNNPYTIWNSSSSIQNKTSQTELYGNIKTGEVNHKLLMGYEYSQSTYNFANTYIDNSGGYMITGYQNLYNPAYISPPNQSAFNSQWLNQNNSKTNAVYAQDQLAIGDWRVLAGVRSERTNTNYNGWIGYNPTISNTVSATTGRLGLLYMITPSTSAYYSISQSFDPNSAYVGVNNSPLPTSRGLQNEIGLKHSLWTGFDATVSLFDITKSNIPTPNGDGTYTAIGAVQSKGWEASIVGQATPSTRVIANATGLNAVVSQGYTDSMGVAVPVGTQMYGVPRFSANAWGVQDLSLNIPGKSSLGLGVVYVGDRVATTPNTAGLVLPSYATLDAGLFYKIDKIDLALNVKNITNTTIINPLQNMFVARQPGINYLLTAGIHF